MSDAADQNNTNENNMQQKDPSSWVGWWILVGVLSFLTLVYAILAFAEWMVGSPEDRSALGLLGDSFGVVNAIVSSGALIAAIVAIFLQRKELAEQRREMELAREQYTDQARSLGEQAAAMTAQNKIALLNGLVEVTTTAYTMAVNSATDPGLLSGGKVAKQKAEKRHYASLRFLQLELMKILPDLGLPVPPDFEEVSDGDNSDGPSIHVI